MNHRRQLAAALACATALGLCAGHTLADEATASPTLEEIPLILAPVLPQDESSTPSDESSAPVQSKPIIVEPDDIPSYIPKSDMEDKSGTVSFENLSARMRENNLNILSLNASIDSIDAIDYDEMKDSLKAAIREIEATQDNLSGMIQTTSSAFRNLVGELNGKEIFLNGNDYQYLTAALVAYPQATIASLDGQISSLKNTLNDIRDGIVQEKSRNAIQQLGNARNQILMGGETLYITLLGLEQTQQGLQRQLEALDRTIAELEVRYEMGQISALTLSEVKAGRSSLVSGMKTLEMNLTNLNRQLECMLGLEITGKLQLQPLKSITKTQLAAMNYENDLQSAKDNSYDIKAARFSLYSAEEDLDGLNLNTCADYEIKSAEYAVDAAELSLKATEQSVELKFAALYDLIHDQQQVLAASQTSLAVKKDNYAVAQLKYSQGVLSKNALLDAEDAVSEAQAAVDTAAVDLFTSYNNYRWAVDHGILN